MIEAGFSRARRQTTGLPPTCLETGPHLLTIRRTGDTVMRRQARINVK